MFARLATSVKTTTGVPSASLGRLSVSPLFTGLTSTDSTSSSPFVVQSAKFSQSTAVLGEGNDGFSFADPADAFLSGTNTAALEGLYLQWKDAPESVDASFARFFENMDAGVESKPYSYNPPLREIKGGSSSNSGDAINAVRDTARILLLARAYRVRGHFAANLDPLGIATRHHVNQPPHYSQYGLTEADLDRKFYVGDRLFLDSVEEKYEWKTLREILDYLESRYCGTVGSEFFHIPSSTEKDWLCRHFEAIQSRKYSKDQKIQLLKGLVRAEGFENFLKKKYSTAKRFGLEGGESLIPGMEFMLEQASNLGIDTSVLGMPHRGRLNVLFNIVQKPGRAILHEFAPADDEGTEDLSLGSGDVKYHLGTSCDRLCGNGKQIHMSLAANPSHLEAVNPVVEGKTRAKQFVQRDYDRKKVMAVLLHGDAAFAGQGIVAETLDFANLVHYQTGGTIHIIVNNQIGFTTDPKYSRSTPYPSDAAKTIGAPIFHVNGDDVEATARMFELSVEYRQKFGKSAVIDMWCYRRHGHNETDQPSFTQPYMYSKIEKHPSTLNLYGQQLINEGVITPEEFQSMNDKFMEDMEVEFEAAKTYKTKDGDWLEKNWQGFKAFNQNAVEGTPTGVDDERFDLVAGALVNMPEGFDFHRGIQRVLKQRKEMVETGKNFDWGMAESMAFGTLLMEDVPVRLSGQDVERGTFSHRHAVLHDADSGKTLDYKAYVPLRNIHEKQARFRATNSNLSEAAVLGFELGHSLESPNQLVIWEAQFGDFANSAQVIIDQFLVSGEQKWLRQSGLTVLLPHGYDGQGPEHSSARLERFLQASDEDEDTIPSVSVHKMNQLSNIQVVNCTTPANYYHALRRQVHREFRKPLIVMSPKKLLRYKHCVSDREEFTGNTKFQYVFSDNNPARVDDKDVRKVVFCSGQVYYQLLEQQQAGEYNDVALVRVEQLAPFPFEFVRPELERFPNAEVVWAQEEPKNAGAWAHARPRISALLESMNDSRKVNYVGRKASAAPATGSAANHQRQVRMINEKTFG